MANQKLDLLILAVVTLAFVWVRSSTPWGIIPVATRGRIRARSRTPCRFNTLERRVQAVERHARGYRIDIYHYTKSNGDTMNVTLSRSSKAKKCQPFDGEGGAAPYSTNYDFLMARFRVQVLEDSI